MNRLVLKRFHRVGLLLAFMGCLVPGSSAQAAIEDCEILFSGKKLALNQKAAVVQGLVWLEQGERVAAGEYLYLIDIRGRVVMAPRVFIGSSSRTSAVQTHLQLEAGAEFSAIVAAGELKVNSRGELAWLNNRSGSFRPGRASLNAAYQHLKTFFKTSATFKAEDYSQITRAHPLYVENKILDVLHTISTVALIGKEEFQAAMKSKNPLAEIKKKMIAAQKKALPQNVKLEDRRPVYRPEVLESADLQKRLTQELKPLRNWSKIKSENRELGSPRSWNQFYRAYKRQRSRGRIYWNWDEFVEVYSKNIRLSDEIDASYTVNEIDTQVTWNQKVYVVSLLHVSIDLDGGITTESTPYHNEVLESWASELGWPEDRHKILDHQRGGIFIRKKKGDSELRFYQADQREFRFGGPNWERPDTVERIRE